MTNLTLENDMKLKNLKLLFIAIAASATGLALTGCQTTAGESHRKAVACEKCKTVWVPGAGPSKFAGYSTTTRMPASPTGGTHCATNMPRPLLSLDLILITPPCRDRASCLQDTGLLIPRRA